MKHIGDSLAGRAAIMELENLSLDEIRSAAAGQDTRDAFETVICRGQFPELWRNREMRPALFYSSYLASYLERDVRQILNVTSLRDFERFIRVLAARSGSILNKSDISKDVGVSVKAIGDWISVLAASGQIMLLEPWYHNFGKRLVKSPKIYFRDTGLLSWLLGIDAETLHRSPFAGALWETFIFAELRKSAAYRDRRLRLWYYRDQTGREIDFVLEKGGTLSLAEAKWTESPDAAAFKTIDAVRSDLEKSGGPWLPGDSYVFARAGNSYPLREGGRVLCPGDVGRVFG
jgi:hypothetical protein